MTNNTANNTLTVIANDKFKKEFKPKCRVQMDKEQVTYDEFVVVGYNPDTTKTTMFHNADPVTLGQAFLMVQEAFRESLKGLDMETKEDIKALILLGGK